MANANIHIAAVVTMLEQIKQALADIGLMADIVGHPDGPQILVFNNDGFVNVAMECNCPISSEIYVDDKGKQKYINKFTHYGLVLITFCDNPLGKIKGGADNVRGKD